MKAQRLVFSEKQEVHLETFEPAAPGAGQVTAKAICSLISTGTEGIVFNRLFDPGTSFDRWVKKYPFYPGYSLLSEIVEVGPGVKDRKMGQRVVSRHGHTSYITDLAEKMFPVPDGVSSDQAVWFALAKIAAMGMKAADFRLGKSVAVIGAGPVGQMAMRWALAAGSQPVIAIDTEPMRLELARRGGVTDILAKSIQEAVADLSDMTQNQLLDIVVDSTGHPAVFGQALRAVRRFGTLLLLGTPGSPDQQHLTDDVMTRGLHIVGTHDAHDRPEWNTPMIVQLFFDLVRQGRFNVDGLITHRFAPQDCMEAYRTINKQRGQTMGIAFDWSQLA